MVQRKFDRIHMAHTQWGVSLRRNLVTGGTIIPLIMNDDALGDPMSFNAHPEHASWAEVDEPNCYPDSEIRNFQVSLEIQALHNLWDSVTLGARWQSPKISIALIACAFPEDLDAIDERSGLSLKAMLELQKESTDRQCYPLYNAVDLLGIPTIMPTNVPGLT